MTAELTSGLGMKQFGGITGDLAGYLVQMTELLILLLSVLYMLVGNIVK